MPSRYYNDPSLAAGFNNLASIFAPPDPGVAANLALAAQRRAQEERISRLFDYAQADDLDQVRFDRMGQAANLWDPAQGYYGVNVRAETSRANNAADNARAIATTLLTPVGENTIRHVPRSIADFYEINTMQPGLVSVGEDEEIYTPLGDIIVGPRSPLSETEMDAQIINDLRESGMLSNQDLLDRIIGAQPLVQVADPDSPSGATFSTRGAAAREGAPAFVNRGAEARPENAVAILETDEGTQEVPAIQGADGRWYFAQQPDTLLPDGFRLRRIPQVQDTAEGAGLPTTSNRSAATNLEADARMGLARVAAFRQLIDQNPGIVGLPGLIQGVAQDTAEVIGELGAAYGEDVVDANNVLSAVQDQAERARNDANYNPAIRQARAMFLEMAYLDARLSRSDGRISVAELQQHLRKYNGMLNNAQGILAELDRLEESLNTRLNVQIPILRGQAPVESAEPATVERWERGPDGGLRRVQ